MMRKCKIKCLLKILLNWFNFMNGLGILIYCWRFAFVFSDKKFHGRIQKTQFFRDIILYMAELAISVSSPNPSEVYRYGRN